MLILQKLVFRSSEKILNRASSPESPNSYVKRPKHKNPRTSCPQRGNAQLQKLHNPVMRSSKSYTEISPKRGPQYRPQNTVTLIMGGTPKDVPLILGNPAHGESSHRMWESLREAPDKNLQVCRHTVLKPRVLATAVQSSETLRCCNLILLQIRNSIGVSTQKRIV